ncbi:hypothetical protein HOG48_02395 [Candidatus Peregrinibacteria bacterium]|jgi:hypothetical protein|nr:hypothetical protein [Candidatus Peregrinibacteria bacterium]
MTEKKTDEEQGQEFFANAERIAAEGERKSSVQLVAFYYRERFLALVTQGFTTAQAMEIIKARGIMM